MCTERKRSDGRAGDARLAYATAARLRSVMLIYRESPAGACDVELVDGLTTVKVRALRLDSSAELLREQFRTLAGEIMPSL